jgi:Na+/H+ antiporter NhaC
MFPFVFICYFPPAFAFNRKIVPKKVLFIWFLFTWIIVTIVSAMLGPLNPSPVLVPIVMSVIVNGWLYFSHRGEKKKALPSKRPNE